MHTNKGQSVEALFSISHQLAWQADLELKPFFCSNDPQTP